MDYTFSNIFETIKLCDELEAEFKKRFGWLHFREKREYKKIKKKVEEKIQSLYDDSWTVDYIRCMQLWFKAYYMQIKYYMGDEVYISETFDPYDEDREITIFDTMYFEDQKNKNHIITLDVVGDNINFVITDTSTGNHFSASSEKEVQPSQKNIESVCKNCIVLMFTRYFNKKYT